MIKVRRSVLVVTAAAVVVGVAAFALTHTHQSMEVITGTESSSNIASINIGPDKFSSSNNQIASHIVPQKGAIPPGKIIKEPGDTNKPKPRPTIDKFAELKSQYGLLTIPTYDGSNQLTHPKVLYFANGWHGYHYWMSMTPYPYTMDRYENPSIVVSNDGEKWVVPIGLKNPISGLPVDVKIGGHYSDPHLVMRGNVMELWYRYNPGNSKTHHAVSNINIYYKRTSTDGIHWSAAQFLFNSGNDGHYSLAVNYEDGIYKAWYATNKGKLCFSQSNDSVNWSQPVVASVPLPTGYVPYHQDMIKIGSQYCLLQCAQKPSNYTFAEFFASSSDGINFSNVKRIYPTTDTALWDNVSIYRSSMFEKNGKLEMYLTIWFQATKYNGLDGSWRITHRTFPLHDFLPPESSSPSMPSSEPSKPPISSSTPASEPSKSPASSSIPSSELLPQPVNASSSPF